MNHRSFFKRNILITTLLLLISTVGHAEIFTVINTNDSGPGSFRQAIIEANNRTGADSIIFNIPMSDPNYNNTLGVWTIRPDSALPDVVDDSTMINGTSQMAFIGSDSNPKGPEIELDGTNAGVSDGIYILSAHNVVKGLVINRFQQFGIQISFDAAIGNIVIGNFIGTDVTGTMDLGNRFSGVIIYNGAKRNIIGGATEDKRNIISGNDWSGVEIQAWRADSNVVIGNYIGTDVTGNEDLGNEVNGVYIWSGAKYNQIGGVNDNEGNVISGNGWSGISIVGPGTDYNVVLNNIIGMNKDVTVAMPNKGSGIGIGGNFNIVGGTIADEGNIISGNRGSGIGIGAGEGNIVAGNYIGTDKTGALVVPNTFGGISIVEGAHNNVIGPENIIHFNRYDGIKVEGSSTIANKITRNSITANAELGINNVDGGNTELTPPSILSYSNAEIRGTAPPNSVVEIFSDNADEGSIFEGAVSADALGNFNWMGTPAGPFITATATDAAGNTSEFSDVLRIVGVVVTNTDDSGMGSFRWAIEEANRNAAPDTIVFNIPTTDPGFDGTVWNIQPVTQLPALTDNNTFIDGHSQAVNQGDQNFDGPEIMLDGSLLATNKFGLEIKSSNNTISGLIVSKFDWAGININGENARHNRIWGNYIGTNPASTDTLPNGTGITISNGPKHNIIGGQNAAERNVISGNKYVGIEINNADSNSVIGNLIGTDITGTKDVGNIGDGIDISYGARGNRIGGASPDERNIISGNDQLGINIYNEGTLENVVSGNFIGTDISGTNTLGNAQGGVGIYYKAKANVIGGLSQNEGNLISGNGWFGIIISNNDADSNLVASNRIGTDINGIIALRNGRDGIFISNEVCHNRIGPNNIISGNKSNGIRIQGQGTDSTMIRGNLIGLNATGQDTLSNGGNGILIEYGSRYTVIGGSSDADRNVIAGNGWNGIRVYGDSTGYTHFINNYIGTNVNGNNALGNKRNGLELSGVHHLVQHNLISGNQQHGLLISRYSKSNVVSENKIGVQVDGIHALVNEYSGVRIQGHASTHTIGPNNQIWNNGGHGISLTESTVSKITITANSISDNASSGIRLYNGANNNIETPVITGISPLSGTAVPNCIVEVFSDSSDQGRVYEGSVTSDAFGNWTWQGTMNGPNMTVTATDVEGNTSEFSEEIPIVADRPTIINPIQDLTLKEDFDTHLVIEDLYTVFQNAPPETIMTFSSTSLDSIVQPLIRSDSLFVQSIHNAFGLDEVVVTAKNNHGLLVSDTFSVTILSVNDTPIFSNLPDTLYFKNDSSISLNIWEYVDDVETQDSLLTYQFTTTNDSLITHYNEKNGILSLSVENDFVGNVDLIIEAVDDSNALAKDTSLVIVEKATSVKDATARIPKEFRLYQNYPNPFNPETVIKYQIPEACHITLRIYDMLGREVRTLVEEEKPAGLYEVGWDGENDHGQRVASGVYFYRLEAMDLIQTRKMVFLQ